MKLRKKGYWILFALTVIMALLTLWTILPSETASKESMLGYKAQCSFAPLSTFVCAIFTGMVCFIRKRFFVSYK
ncbi:MAG: hypothetical protein C0597_11405 [Marinilabiliales bacterium]|nr:MAG: hypothetical protein C0597_11405 [Marinilabiliales bacterium]